jgi:hypothetical protein
MTDGSPIESWEPENVLSPAMREAAQALFAATLDRPTFTVVDRLRRMRSLVTSQQRGYELLLALAPIVAGLHFRRPPEVFYLHEGVVAGAVNAARLLGYTAQGDAGSAYAILLAVLRGRGWYDDTLGLASWLLQWTADPSSCPVFELVDTPVVTIPDYL